MQEIEKIDHIVEPDNSRFQSVDTSLGGFWRSDHTIETVTEYSTDLPPGLHLGGGIADISIYSATIGRHSANGPMVNIVNCPPASEEVFHTRLGIGRNTSCGLYIPHSEQHEIPRPVRSLIALLPKDQFFYAATTIPRSILARLCEPFQGWTHPEALRLAGEARVYELLALLIQSMANKGPRLKKNLQQKIVLAREIINNNLAKPPNLQQLASQVGLNVRSLTAYFRQAYGMSVIEYQNHCRMEKALRLLESGLSVSQTADLLGYTLPYFSQKFRQRYGIAASSVKAAYLEH